MSVTVVIPCYNYGRYLPVAVGAALEQGADVIVVDDASTDDSLQVARSLESARVRVVAHEVNRGHIQTYNDGLALAESEYVALVSADDVLAPGSLGVASSVLDAHPNVGMVYGRYLRFRDTLPEVRPLEGWRIYPGHSWLRMHLGTNPIASPEVVMRRTAYEQAGPYDASLPHSADLAMWIRTAERWDVARVNSIQAFYRQHASNMHSTYSYVRDLEEQRRTWDTSMFAAEARKALAYRALRMSLGLGWWDSLEPPVAELRAFAQETYPRITRSPLWWRCAGILRHLGPNNVERVRLRVARWSM